MTMNKNKIEYYQLKDFVSNNKDRFFLNLTLAIILFLSYLGHVETINFELYFGDLHGVFRDFFSKKINTNLAHPIWGYGFLIYLFNNPILLLLVQYLLFIISVNLLYNYFRAQNTNLTYLKVLIFFSLPAIFFHSQLWPKSIVSSLVVISIIQLVKFLDNGKKINLYSSFIFLSLSLHFRSDYYFLIHFLIIFLFFFKRIKFLRLIFLIFLSHIIISPWGLHNLKNNKRYIETSSNMGHVLVLGLGQLPNNLWGLSPKDGDPVFNRMIQDNFGENAKSTDIEVNNFLKRKFLTLIMKNPSEYLKKVFYAFKLYLIDPFYIGNLDNYRMNGSNYITDLRSAETSFYDLKLYDGFNYLKRSFEKVGILVFLKIIITLLTKLIGYLVMFLTIYNVLKYLKKIFSNIKLLIILSIIIYQFLISIFAFHMPTYTTSIYLIFIFLLFQLKNIPNSSGK